MVTDYGVVTLRAVLTFSIISEWQSADRCHRIGQTRPCTITRLCIEDSVESRMVLLQEKKTNMINSTINADDAAMDSLSPEDLQFLFRGT